MDRAEQVYLTDPTPEPIVITHCDICGDEIYIMDEFVRFDMMDICMNCIRHNTVTADYE